MIEDWPATITELAAKTWNGELKWEVTRFKKITPKKAGALIAFQTELQGNNFSLYEEFRFRDDEPIRIIIHLDLIDASGQVLNSTPTLESLGELLAAVKFMPWKIDEAMRRELVTENFLIRFDKTYNSNDYKGRSVFYEEPGFRLNLYVETCSKDGKYFWGGTTQQFAKWTYPAETEIALEKQQEIMNRLMQWGEKHNECLEFARGITWEEMKADYLARGWTVTENPNGSRTCSPPKRANSKKP